MIILDYCDQSISEVETRNWHILVNKFYLYELVP